MGGDSKKAFDFSRSNIFVVDPAELVIVGLDTDDGEGHPLYDATVQEPLDPAFVANVEAEGVIVPVTITKFDGRACVVAGRTRVRAAREVNKGRKPPDRIRVRCEMTGGTDVKLRRKRIAENSVRKVVDVITKANEAQELLDQGMTLEDVAITFAVSKVTVSAWLAVQGACKDVKQAAIAGKITAGAAAKIAKLDGAPAQKEALDQALAAGPRASTKAARKAVAAKTGTADPVGLGKRQQRKLLDYAVGGEQDLQTDYWSGFADAIRLALGDEVSDDRARAARSTLS